VRRNGVRARTLFSRRKGASPESRHFQARSLRQQQPFARPDQTAASDETTPLGTPSRDQWGKGTRDPSQRQFLRGPRPRTLEMTEAARVFGECLKGPQQFGLTYGPRAEPRWWLGESL
jgi:hypothetical protein